MQAPQILGLITLLLFIVWMAPNVLRMNAARGSTLRNIALWLAIFVGLMLTYNFIH